jgi:hypothetical protein
MVPRIPIKMAGVLHFFNKMAALYLINKIAPSISKKRGSFTFLQQNGRSFTFLQQKWRYAFQKLTGVFHFSYK